MNRAGRDPHFRSDLEVRGIFRCLTLIESCHNFEDTARACSPLFTIYAGENRTTCKHLTNMTPPVATGKLVYLLVYWSCDIRVVKDANENCLLGFDLLAFSRSYISSTSLNLWKGDYVISDIKPDLYLPPSMSDIFLDFLIAAETVNLSR